MRRFVFLKFFLLNLALLPSPGIAVKIGIILPIQHTALEEIIEGFKEEITPHLSPEDEIIIKNAQGDPTLQYQIIQQMKKSQLDYFLPVSTSTALMTLSVIKKIPIIAVAAKIDFEMLKKEGSLQNKGIVRGDQSIGVINDEIEIRQLFQFIKTVLPSIKTVGVIYGNSEKNFSQIQLLQDFCQKNGIDLHLRKIEALPEMLQAAQSVFPQVEAVVIMKDNIVVNGIGVLVKIAKKDKKLLIAMDDASVKKGAHFALGVPEKEIGKAAALQLIEALKGNSEKAYRLNNLSQLCVFYNKVALEEASLLSAEHLKQAASALNFSIQSC
jgi:putative ABC transport system substrate-binding protein